ncbi:ATP/GTP-binding protein [Streptomyces sp. R302]|uniref:FG-GAP-like repeat-containing protein n=1 Tax=unclassified Streptomyces TaxID=2593676 RepID=UPI00145E385C|nr:MULTISPECIES: FG-GAP-like repeat-containing protein [unclassified Streptomyces]NML50159.1 ATP/GTP-binding protein [Streptomyces sp. R301]NML79150.1 ATP/GTP-binding protein [Streptomyces sp. R302]
MRKTMKRGLASLLGMTLLGGLAVATAAPAQAAVSDCPKGYFCAWKTEDATGTMFKTNKSMPTLGSWNNTFRAQVNHSSQIVCTYDLADYKLGTYWSIDPTTGGAYESDPYGSVSSLKFVRTERECWLDAYPRWYAETSPKAAGFGDLNGDRKADVLVRDLVGRLWYLPGDSTGRLVGSGGWNGMNALVRHGDFSRDGKEDVIARERATGKLWLYPGTGTGGLAPRKLIGSGGWNGMSRIAAVGDLTRDGRADLLAVEKSTGKLWLYPGTGNGLAPRKLIGTGGWNGMNALTGPGDMNSDGRVDLVAREASTGKLWLYPGTSTGRLGARKLIGTGGWNAMETFLSIGDFSGDGRVDLATITNARYAIDGYQGHLGWLLTYNGRGTGSLAAGQRFDGDWWGLNGAF